MRCPPPRTRSPASSPPARSSCGCAAASPSFVVTPPPADGARRAAADEPAGPLAPPDGDEGGDRADQPAPAGAAQGPRRGGRRPRAAVGQRLARARRRRRARGDDPTAARGSAAAGRPEPHRLGALAPARPHHVTDQPDRFEPDPRGGHSHAYFRHPRTDLGHGRRSVGDVRFTAGDRTDTVVEVRPSDPQGPTTSGPPSRPRSSTRAAQLLVKAPKLRSWLGRSGGGRST